MTRFPSVVARLPRHELRERRACDADGGVESAWAPRISYPTHVYQIYAEEVSILSVRAVPPLFIYSVYPFGLTSSRSLQRLTFSMLQTLDNTVRNRHCGEHHPPED